MRVAGTMKMDFVVPERGRAHVWVCMVTLS
jgi:hypothetical protein